MGVLDKSDEQYLRPWLVRTLEPICDADPKVLSEYVLALVKHDEPESQLRTSVEQQLSEFLDSEARPFVEKLFQALRSKSFIPYDDPQPYSAGPSSGIPIPLDGLVRPPPTEPRGTKRGAEREHEDSIRRREPPKGPRRSLDHDRPQDGRNGAPPSAPRASQPPRGPAGRGNGTQKNTREPANDARELCRDYHTRGFCPRGELCKFQHGEEAIVPPMSFVNGMGMNPLQMMTMMQNGGIPMPWMMMGLPGADGDAYNPNDAQMDLSNVSNVRGPNRGLNGTDSVDLTPAGHVPSPFAAASHSGPSSEVDPMGPQSNGNGTHFHEEPRRNSHEGRGRGRGRGGHRGGHSGRQSDAPGTFPHEQPTFDQPPPQASSSLIAPSNPQQDRSNNPNNSKTIVVEKIPPDHLTLSAVSTWFSKYGTVTNVAIDSPTAKALVSFSTHDEARAAWSTQEAVFGNRFVKLFWHRPLAGHGEAGRMKLAASAPLVQNIAASNPNGEASPSSSSTLPQTQRSASTASANPPPAASTSTAPPLTPAASMAARKQLLEKQIAEQKALFASLETATTPEQKKEIMAKLRTLGEEMKKGSSTPGTAKAASSSSTTSPLASRRTSTTGAAALTPEAKLNLMREKLDKELELHAAKTGPTGDVGDAEETKTGGRQAELLAELADLKKQAEAAGVSKYEIAGGAPPAPAYRARGFPRARGAPRGRGMGVYSRGAAPIRSLKLDNRPKRLVIKGVDTNDEGVLESLQIWYKNAGVVEAFETTDTDEVQVQFQTRAAAEQALAKGNPPGATSLTWHAPARPSGPSPAAASTSTSTPTDAAEPPELVVAETKEDGDVEVGADETEVPKTIENGVAAVGQPSHVLHDSYDDGWGAGGGFDD